MANGFFSQLQALNQRLSVNQKLSLLALTTVILCSILGFVYLIQRQPYQLLFSNLEAADAQSVSERLKQLKIPFRLEDGGRSVLVPAERISEARLQIASQGLPSTGRLGFELFDQNNWGITDFAEKVNYRRALEGELERTILSLQEIAQARVHLVMEKDSLFEQDRQPAKASVVIKLKRGNSLPPDRVRGILNLVAFAVEGLRPENVTVVDVAGNLLSGARGPEEALDDSQLEVRRKMEKDLEQKVISMLEPLVGKERVRVTASLQLDYSEVQQTEEIFDPDRRAILSEQRTEEVIPQKAVGGIPFRANEGGNQAAAPGQEVAAGRRQSEVLNYEVSKTVRQVREPRGSVKQLSVAVVVDDRVVTQTDEEGQVKELTQPRTPEEMERLHNVVAAAIGFNPQRGDVLTVENISFQSVPAEPLEVGEPGLWDRYRDVILPIFRYLSILLLFVLFYLLVFRPVKKRVFAYVEVEEPMYTQLQQGQARQQLQGREFPQLGAAEEQASLSESDVARVEMDLRKIAESKPEAVTNLVRAWLSQGAR